MDLGTRRSLLFALALLGLGQAIVRAEPPGNVPSGSTVSAATIEDWVADLDADQFAIRASATNQLIAAGAASIGPVVAAMEEGRRERIARGVHVLARLGQSRDLATQEAARAALEGLAAQTTTEAARRARASLDELDWIRQHRATRALSWLGASIQLTADPFDGFDGQRPYLIQIDERWTGTDEHLVHLRSLVDIQHVVFRGPQVRDTWLESIRSLPKVESISILHARISDEGLAHLSGIPSLQHLKVWYAPITDGAVESLQRLETAQSVQLYGTKITRQGATALQSKLAHTTIDVRNGAFLGVGAGPNAPCVLNTVRPGSAAQAAGFQIGDIVTHYNGNEIQDFEGLRQLISTNRPGDEVEVKIERNSQTLTKRVRLGEWDLNQVSNR
jgi:hypothetical protein